MAPEISVLMAVFNGESYLKESLESILNQSYKNFEFIIVDDGSTDNTPAILKECHDPRVVLLKNDKNLGLACSLNRGLTCARGSFIARQDADDISLPHRLAFQLSFLKEKPSVGILGSYCHLIDRKGHKLWLYKVPLLDLQIRWKSLLENPFVHPAVMLRREVLLQHKLSYDETLQTAQDYELWTRVLKYTQGANLKEPLVNYRLSQGITCTRKEEQIRVHNLIALRTIQQNLPGFSITLEQVSSLCELFAGGKRLLPLSKKIEVNLAHLYLDMFESFLQRYAEEPGVELLLKDELFRAALLFFTTPLQKGWIRMVRRLFKMHPGLPLSLTSLIPDIYLRLIRRIIIYLLFKKERVLLK